MKEAKYILLININLIHVNNNNNIFKQVKAAKDEGWSQVGTKGKVKQSMFEKGTDVTHVVAVKKLNEIKMNRGKRSTMRSDIVDQLNELKGICQVDTCLF